MLSLSFALCVFTIVASTHNIKREGRIINGIPTTHSEYPFMVSLRVVVPADTPPYDNPFCGGTIIRSEHPMAVLTAAHCLGDETGISSLPDSGLFYDIFADIGRESTASDVDMDEYQRFSFINYVTHPDLTFDALGQQRWNDIAIIFFDGKTDQDPVALNNDPILDLSGKTLRIIGYGDAGDNPTKRLQYADVTYIDDATCNAGWSQFASFLDPQTLAALKMVYGIGDDELPPWDYLQFPEGEMCTISPTGNEIACTGDSGGPIMLMDEDNYVQVGIPSFGPFCTPQFPSTNTDVGYYYQWIQETLALYPTDSGSKSASKSSESSESSDSDSEEKKDGNALVNEKIKDDGGQQSMVGNGCGAKHANDVFGVIILGYLYILYHLLRD